MCDPPPPNLRRIGHAANELRHVERPQLPFGRSSSTNDENTARRVTNDTLRNAS